MAAMAVMRNVLSFVTLFVPNCLSLIWVSVVWLIPGYARKMGMDHSPVGFSVLFTFLLHWLALF
jgi:hypothetical protein